MSIEARDWAWRQKVRGLEKLVLLALAEPADETGHAWPSLNTVSKACGIPRSTVVRQLASLQEHGLIRREREERPNGANSSTRYWLDLAVEYAGEIPLTHHATRGGLTHSATSLDAPRNKGSRTVQQALVAPRNNKVNRHLEPSLEPSLEPCGAAEPQPPPVKRGPRVKREETWEGYVNEETFTAAMIKLYGDLGLGEEWVRDEIAAALDHKSRLGYTHMGRYVGRWLKRDAPEALRRVLQEQRNHGRATTVPAPTSNNGASRPSAPTFYTLTDHETEFFAERERQRIEKLRAAGFGPNGERLPHPAVGGDGPTPS